MHRQNITKANITPLTTCIPPCSSVSALSLLDSIVGAALNGDLAGRDVADAADHWLRAVSRETGR